jgi:hypothetical protein
MMRVRSLRLTQTADQYLSPIQPTTRKRLIVGSCRRFDERLIQPKRLGFDEIDPVLELVGEFFPGSNSNSAPRTVG